MSYSIFDFLYIHLFIEFSWKLNISYLATCPIKKQGGMSGIVIKVISLTHSGSVGSRENLHGIHGE